MTALALGLAALAQRMCAAAMAASGLATVVMVVLVSVEVLGRDFFNTSTLVADEMAGYLLVALTFLGLAPTLRSGGFIRIDTYRERLRGGTRRAVDLSIHLLALAYTALLNWYLWGLTINSYRLGTTSINVTRTPLWVPQVVMALGAALLFVELLGRMALLATGQNAEPEGTSTAEL